MRIVGGQWRGKKLVAPGGLDVRPTADRVREAWMSIISPWLPESRVLDLFAGSGALGIEALSRGAATVDLVENDPRSLAAIAQNLAGIRAGAEVRVHKVDAMAYVAALALHSYDIAFADPPYDSRHAPQLAEQWLAAPFAAILGIEHRAFDTMPEGGERRKYGSSAVTFYRTD